MPYFKDDAQLAQAALSPAQPITVVPTMPPQQRALGGTYNRLGGLMKVTASRVTAEIEAVLAVWLIESGGQTHTPGRATIRFENHLFFKYWGGANAAKFDAHFRFGGHNGIAGKPWENHTFTASAGDAFAAFHGDQTREYTVLQFARSFADEAALKSISIGGPQILGSNSALIGYSSARAMYDAFQAEERWHVLGFFDYCQHAQANGVLLEHLRRHRWVDFAAGYNGAGNAAHYGGLLQAAFADAQALHLPA